MAETVFGLAQQVVIAKIENVLDAYPCHPYQQAFAAPDLRQELIAYVFSRIPSIDIFGEKVPLLNYKASRFYVEQELYLEDLVHQGIYSILREKLG